MKILSRLDGGQSKNPEVANTQKAIVFLFDQYRGIYILFKLSYLLAYDWQELSDLQYGCRFFDAVVHWLHFFEPMPRDLFDRAA